MPSTRTFYVGKRRDLIKESIMLLLEMHGWSNKDLEKIPLVKVKGIKRRIEEVREWK